MLTLYMLYTYTSSASQQHNNKDARVKTQEDFFNNIHLSLYL